MGFQILLNCSDSKFEEKWGLVVTYWEWKGMGLTSLHGKMYFFQLIPRSWLQSKPDTPMKSLGNFLTKQFCFWKMLFQKYFGFSFLTGIPKKPCLDFWWVVANPSPCISTVCNLTVTHLCQVPCSCWWKCWDTYGAVAEPGMSESPILWLWGISELRSGRPQRFRGLGLVSVGLDQSHRHWGVSSFVRVRLGYVSIIQQECRTPVAAFSFWKYNLLKAEGFYSPKENKKLKSN